MVSSFKKTLAGVALAALPLMASAQMAEMKDQALADVNGQLGIIDLTTIGYDVNFGPLGAPLFGLPFTLGASKIGLPGSTGVAVVDFEWTNFGPTVGPFSALNIGVFDVIPGIGPDLISLPEFVFKTGILGGVLGGVGATYILENGLTLPVPVIGFRQVQVI
ncbi:DUF6160 family protein [Candidatus Macondimonas diazotrophica]|jgi:hypothetical protein|uniref:DUF6160 domain-containing protein n=1 Tax=Candidatus Macondimonas diazotrophica TaxID=2305248 RepID=A0A4Z0FED6_9GAMM|nr:DUF6160 family protein [Candidatus Macondimonas diazotrophica]NCU00588.1 hypothetical protein [Candidatus Macondimonas diazotrophica]TFZ84167.1 hypothetical protein E4680_01115 [Candidatus Macondimonas diazotrophica]HBG29278.1 hypothetical protein [Gammaproteobacteria bacterium]